MTDEQKTTQEESRTPFAGMPFAAMMEKMMGQQGQGCNCMEMMSQMMSQQEMDCDCAEMMAKCCGQAQDEEKTASTETAQQA